MKIIVIYSNGISYGGIEVLYIEMVKYMIKQGIEVYFLSDFEETIYKKEFKKNNKVKFIVTNRKPYIPVFYYNKNEIKKLKIIGEKIKEEYFKDRDVIILTQDFYTISSSIGLFLGEDNIYLKTAFYHPEDWAETTRYLKSDGFVLKRKKNKIWYYQREFLQILDKNDSIWIYNETDIKHKNWFYEIELKDRKLIGFPISDLEVQENDNLKLKNEIKDEINILWTGRFDYFKNVALIHIKEVLEELAIRNELLKINFLIVGFGNSKYENEILKKMKSSKINIVLLGKKKPEELKEIFLKNDIGIGMGASVLKMAQMGLASILVDSVNKKNKKYLKATWIFNTFNDAGDNFYWELTGNKKGNRYHLIELLSEVIDGKDKIIDYQSRCKKYVEEKYSLKNNFQDILEEIYKTKLTFKNLKLFEKNIIEKIIRKMAYHIFKK